MTTHTKGYPIPVGISNTCMRHIIVASAELKKAVECAMGLHLMGMARRYDRMEFEDQSWFWVESIKMMFPFIKMDRLKGAMPLLPFI